MDGPTVIGASPELLATLLAEVTEQCEAAFVPIDSLLRPGIPIEETKARLSKVGLVAPTELGVLYAWHEGERDPMSPPSGFPNFSFANLDAAIARYVARAKSELRWSELMPVTDMAQGWLPIDAEGRGLNIKCTQDDEPPLVRHYDPELFNIEDGGQVRSLCTVVTWWLECFDSGAWQWDGSRWIVDFDKYPAAQKAALFY